MLTIQVSKSHVVCHVFLTISLCVDVTTKSVLLLTESTLLFSRKKNEQIHRFCFLAITLNQCTSNWNRVTTIYHCDNCENQYTYKTIVDYFQAIANHTRLTFALKKDIGFFALDNISVMHRYYSTENLISNGDFEFGDLTSWNSCVITGSTSDGRVESNSHMIQFANHTFSSQSGSYFYLGGARNYPEYLSQTFSTTIDEIYRIEFSYVYIGNSSLNSFDFLLSV